MNKKVPLTIDEHIHLAAVMTGMVKDLQVAVVELQGSRRKDSVVMRKAFQAIKAVNGIRNQLDNEWCDLPKHKAWGFHGNIYYGEGAIRTDERWSDIPDFLK